MIPSVVALLGDNPMQSEFACHVGSMGKYFCRVCRVKGTDAQGKAPISVPVPGRRNSQDSEYAGDGENSQHSQAPYQDSDDEQSGDHGGRNGSDLDVESPDVPTGDSAQSDIDVESPGAATGEPAASDIDVNEPPDTATGEPAQQNGSDLGIESPDAPTGEPAQTTQAAPIPPIATPPTAPQKKGRKKPETMAEMVDRVKRFVKVKSQLSIHSR